MISIFSFKIGNRSFNLNCNDIAAVYLFGSVARQDNDKYSDIDFFILIPDCSEDEYISKKKSIAKQLNVPIDWISLYRMSKIEEMFLYGSYFLWHLKFDGIKIYDKDSWFESKLNEISDYNRTLQDLNEYSAVYDDIIISIEEDSLTLNYELNLISTLLRNIAISISCMEERYYFGRYKPVEYCIHNYSDIFGFSIEEYKMLYKFRISYNREYSENCISVPTIEYVKYWLPFVKSALELAKDIYLKRGV